MLLGKKQQAENWIMNHGHLKFECIHCHDTLKYDERGLTCQNQHHFDIAKQGYLFLTKTQTQSQYHQNLFEVRRQIILHSHFYDELHAKLYKLLLQYPVKSLLDAGSGEGSHLYHLTQKFKDITAVGVDLAKEGIRLSTDYNEHLLSIVADLSVLPFKKHSFEGILSILSPTNYDEFHRVLTPEGLYIKVIPNEEYLIEIRRTMAKLALKEYQTYDNREVLAVFAKHFPNYSKEIAYQKVQLTPQQKLQITQMTPLTWSLSAEAQDAVAQAMPDEITLDVTILYNR